MQVSIPENVKEDLELGQKQKSLSLFFQSARKPKVKKSLRPKKTLLKGGPTQALVNRMTNWQRNQWARAGYPADKVGDFATLTKEIRNAAA